MRGRTGRTRPSRKTGPACWDREGRNRIVALAVTLAGRPRTGVVAAAQDNSRDPSDPYLLPWMWPTRLPSGVMPVAPCSPSPMVGPRACRHRGCRSLRSSREFVLPGRGSLAPSPGHRRQGHRETDSVMSHERCVNCRENVEGRLRGCQQGNRSVRRDPAREGGRTGRSDAPGRALRAGREGDRGSETGVGESGTASSKPAAATRRRRGEGVFADPTAERPRP